MPRGKPKKSIKEIIGKGNYRPSIHGVELSKDEIDFTEKITEKLTTVFDDLNNKLRIIDINNDNAKFRFFNGALQHIIKALDTTKKYRIKIKDNYEDTRIDPPKVED